MRQAGLVALLVVAILAAIGIWLHDAGAVGGFIRGIATLLTGRGALAVPLCLGWLALAADHPVQAWILRKLTHRNSSAEEDEDSEEAEEPTPRTPVLLLIVWSLSRIEIGFCALLGLIHISLGHPTPSVGLDKASGLLGQIFGGAATSFFGGTAGWPTLDGGSDDLADARAAVRTYLGERVELDAEFVHVPEVEGVEWNGLRLEPFTCCSGNAGPTTDRANPSDLPAPLRDKGPPPATGVPAAYC